MSGWELAQVNIGRLTAPQDDPRIRPFIEALDAINAVAEESPGFVWRLTGEGNDAMDVRYASDPLLAINMSVWQDADSLFEFVYKSAHTPFMARRKEFFERFDGAYQALWWVPTGHRPSVHEALSKLWLIDRFGSSPQAFTFKAQFPKPGLDGPPIDHQPDPWCVGSA
ncbi:MAG: DUF3291 domain-containing protein [Pseudomonadota bacterium]